MLSLRADHDVVDQDLYFTDNLRVHDLQIFPARGSAEVGEIKLIGPREFSLILASIGLGSLGIGDDCSTGKTSGGWMQSIRVVRRSLAAILAATIAILGILAFVAMILRA